MKILGIIVAIAVLIVVAYFILKDFGLFDEKDNEDDPIDPEDLGGSPTTPSEIPMTFQEYLVWAQSQGMVNDPVQLMTLYNLYLNTF